MPNMSHHTAWPGHHHPDSSMFIGSLGLVLGGAGACFMYEVMLTPKKPQLECGLDVFGCAPVFLSGHAGDITNH